MTSHADKFGLGNQGGVIILAWREILRGSRIEQEVSIHLLLLVVPLINVIGSQCFCNCSH